MFIKCLESVKQFVCTYFVELTGSTHLFSIHFYVFTILADYTNL